MTLPSRPLFALALLIAGCHAPRSPAVSDVDNDDDMAEVASDAPPASTGPRCRIRGALPDPECTPGDVFANVTMEQICTPGYSRSVRHVTARTKREVLAAYGVVVTRSGDYEIDHLVSLQLGGSNEVANLWPQPADPRPGYHEKDRVEGELHRRLCRGEIALVDAQRLIATDWTQASRGGRGR